MCRVVCGRDGEDYNIGARSDIFVVRSKEQIVPQYVVQYEIINKQ